jgi:F-type H+-transporting ATPase subunit delta
MAKNFLRTIIDNGRLNALPEVAAQFRALVNRRNGSSDAVVYSAFPMDSAALADVGSRWKSALAASSISPCSRTSP